MSSYSFIDRALGIIRCRFSAHYGPTVLHRVDNIRRRRLVPINAILLLLEFSPTLFSRFYRFFGNSRNVQRYISTLFCFFALY